MCDVPNENEQILLFGCEIQCNNFTIHTNWFQNFWFTVTTNVDFGWCIMLCHTNGWEEVALGRWPFQNGRLFPSTCQIPTHWHCRNVTTTTFRLSLHCGIRITVMWAIGRMEQISHLLLTFGYFRYLLHLPWCHDMHFVCIYRYPTIFYGIPEAIPRTALAFQKRDCMSGPTTQRTHEC